MPIPPFGHGQLDITGLDVDVTALPPSYLKLILGDNGRPTAHPSLQQDQVLVAELVPVEPSEPSRVVCYDYATMIELYEKIGRGEISAIRWQQASIWSIHPNISNV